MYVYTWFLQCCYGIIDSLLDSSELLGPLVDCVDVSAAPSDPGHLQVSNSHLPYAHNRCYCTRENLVGEKLANREPFAKIFLANIHRHTESIYGICTDCCLFAKFSSPIAFTCMVRQNFPRQIFAVYGIFEYVSYYITSHLHM